MSTRRTLRRELRITPNRRISEAFGYFLALAANETLTGIWGGVCLGNHPHLALIDSVGVAPGREVSPDELSPRMRDRLGEGDQRVGTRDIFFEKLHGRFALWLNEIQKCGGALWDERRVHDMPLLEDGAGIEAAVYMLLNPQRAGIVRHFWEYKGFQITPRDWGKTLRFERPRELDESLVFPEFAELYVHRPPIRRDLSTDELRVLVLERTRIESGMVHAERVADGKPNYTGMRAARRRSTSAVPATPDKRKKGEPIPKFKGREELIEKAKDSLESYGESHRAAMLRVRQGEAATFPAGATRLPWLTCSPRGAIKPDEPTLWAQPP